MNVLVIGDVMVDINYFSKIERNAPEANIPIYNILDVNFILGGASNVANNLKCLDMNVELISVVGNDVYGNKIKTLLENSKINNKLFIDNERKTTQKNRIFNSNSIVVRYDIEDTMDISEIISNNIINYVKEKKNIHSIIISDYDKGVITYSLCQSIIKYCNDNNIYTFVDPKLKNYSKYYGCFCFKPNLNESQKISQCSEFPKIFDFIKKNIQPKHIIITCGENGIYVNNISEHIKHKKNIKLLDVTGAGDVVISILVCCFFKYNDIYISSKISNYIAGKSVEVLGNYTVNIKDVEEYYEEISLKNMNVDNDNSYLYNKVIYYNEIDKLIQFQNKNVVFTNGCFDIIHSAHLRLLNFSKKQGNLLIVGLNSDDSIKQLKGETRPINDIHERTELLLNLNIVDYIVIFSENTPYNILKHIRPNVIVKGGDYTKENVIGGEFANEILLFDYVKNKSTSLVLEKIKKNMYL